MDETLNYLKKIEEILEKNPCYKLEAYTFVLAALHDTVVHLKKPRHISGQELATGICDYALEQFGPMAKTVLEHWGVRETLDFGKIVFALIDVELLSKQPGDKLSDFDKVYEFQDVFGKFKIQDE